ncbi:MAG: XrtA-associated tyrosine autokinase [Pseudomonadales bacterium]|jgi:receptor protein-tyrosine kinase
MDTIEKALDKHRQAQQAVLEDDRVSPAQEPLAADPQPAEASSIFRKEGVSAHEIEHSHTGERSTNTVEIDFEVLEKMGAILPDDSRSKIKEEYKHIKRPLLQKAMASAGTNLPDNLIMVTSAYSGEGKTFSSLNLALSIAVERDCRVLLVDADVVKPGLGRMLGVEENQGLVEYLNGEIESLSDILLNTNINNLTILPAGKTHHLSHELLASNAMRQLAEELSSRYPDRIIIFDSPPVLITSEAKVLSDLVGQIALVIEQDKTSQQAVKDALAKLEQSKISGLILNKSYSLAEGYYGYYYSE